MKYNQQWQTQSVNQRVSKEMGINIKLAVYVLSITFSNNKKRNHKFTQNSFFKN